MAGMSVETAGSSHADASRKAMGRPLPARNEHEGVRGLHPGEYVVLESQKVDMVGDTKFGSQTLKGAFKRTRAGNVEAGIAGELSKGAEQCRVILHRIETADSKPDEFVMQTQFPSKWRASFVIALPVIEVNSIGNDAEIRFCDHSRGEPWFCGGITYGADDLGLTTAETIGRSVRSGPPVAGEWMVSTRTRTGAMRKRDHRSHQDGMTGRCRE